MAKNISVGIDIGTYQIKVAICSRTKENPHPKIIGKGYSESRGLRYGYIINSTDVTKSLKKALAQAESMAGIQIKEAFVSIGGVSLDSVRSRGSTIISRGDNEITELDVEKAIEVSEETVPKQSIINKKVLMTVPLAFSIDGREILGRPVGMKGIKFEAEVLSIMCLEQHLNDLIQAVEDAGIQVQDVVASPIAASLVTLTNAQKIAGVVLANIGSETVSIVVFENSIPISLKVFPIGSTAITNDIALGLKIPLEEAEQIKLGGITSTDVPRKKLDEIVVARLTDIFELIESHLKEINKNAMLPAGIIITGGGSGITTIEDLAKATLRLPSRVAKVQFNNGNYVQDSSWAVAYGLCILGLSAGTYNSGINLVKNTKKGLYSWIKKLLP